MPNIDLNGVTHPDNQSVVDYAGNVHVVGPNVPAFIGRRFGGENLVTEQDMLASPWVTYSDPASVTEDTVDVPENAAASYEITCSGSFDGRQVSGVMDTDRTYLSLVWAKGAVGGETVWMNDASGSAGFHTVTTSWVLYAKVFTPISSVFTVGVKNDGETVKFAHLALIDVTAQINPYIPYADIGLSHLTTNASYEHDGVLHELVGCAIKDRPDFDGSTQYVTLGSTYITEADDKILFDALGQNFNGATGHIVLDGDSSSDRMSLFWNGSRYLISGSGSVVVKDSSHNLLLEEDIVREVEISGIAVGRRLKVFAANYLGSIPYEGAIYNVRVIGSDGTLKHFWKGGATDADWQDQIGSNHGTIVNGPLTVLADTDRGLALRPQATEEFSDNIDVSDYTTAGASINDNTVLSPRQILECDEIVEDSSTGGHGVYRAPSVAIVAGQSNVIVFAVRRVVGSRHISIRGDHPSSAWITVDMDNHTIAKHSSVATAGISAVHGPWVYGYMTWVAATSGSSNLVFALSDVTTASIGGQIGNSYAGDGSSSMAVFATSFNSNSSLPFDLIINETSGSLVQEETLLTESISPVTNGITVTLEGFWPFNHDDDKGSYARMLCISNGATLSHRLEVTLDQTAGHITLEKANDGTTVAQLLSQSYSAGDAFKLVVTAGPAGMKLDLDGVVAENTSVAAKADFAEALTLIAIGSRTNNTLHAPLNVTSASYVVESGSGSYHHLNRRRRYIRAGV